MTESDFVDTRTDLDAVYPCPDVECEGVVEYETTGYWQCSECSFRTKHIENKVKLQGENPMTQQIIKAHRINGVLVDARVVASCPSYIYNIKSVKERAEALKAWADEFNAFIRDHRSQDPVYLTVERVQEDQCSVCGQEWEPISDGGPMYCATCGAEIEMETT